MLKTIFKKDKKYTFSDYFDMNNPTEEIVNELGYSFVTKPLTLSLAENIDKKLIKELQETFYAILPKITLNSEMAKRDFMIAPLLWGILRQVDAKLNVEYPIEINNRLGGFLDYLIRSKGEIVVIEAKKGDLDKGFNQLSAELIALDQFEKEETPALIYGIVSIGELWRFGVLERKKKHIIKDLHTYRIPEDIEMLFLIILGILQT